MINSNGRIKGRISIVDIVLVVAVLALAGGFMYRQLSPRIGQILGANIPLHVTISSQGVRHFVTDAVQIDDVMFRQNERNAIGTVVDIRIEPFYNYLIRSDGTAQLVQSELRYRIFITLEATGSETDRGYYVNGLDHMAPGSDISLVSNRVFIPVGRVYSVERVD